MAAIAVDAAFVADSSQSAVVLMAWAAAATPTGDSSIAATLGVATDIAAAMSADSGVVANAALFDATVICFCDADSAMTADAFVLKTAFANIVAGAQLAIDPVGVILIRAAQSSGVPATAKPPTIPTIRITPPAPPAPSFSVSANPPRRREER